ncbi:MAG: response regulator [Desulfobacteraceae bacterium]|nr:response regulator transcription factor [Desulfobacteraceae bacterium]MBC2754167.1 response regulator [Desulfobacteraceae bacterium]
MKPKRKMRVMVVDDEDHVRKLITTVIKKMNCDIVGEASNGKEAVTLFSNLKPNMLLLDINMPLKSGKEALADIKKGFPNAFIIMLTSLTDKETVEDCIELGASGFIRKDLPLDEMRDVIKKTWAAYRETFTQE